MTENIADILDDCLESLLRGDSVESCLLRYPDLAEELEPLVRTAALTLDLARVAPGPAHKEAAKERLLARARAEASRAPRPIPVARRFRLIAAPLAAAFLLAVALAGAIAVSADSTPDDAAYPIKRAAETVQLMFSRGDEKTARHLELADRRLDELERIADRRGIVYATLLADLAKETEQVVVGLDRTARKDELGEKLFALTSRQQNVLRRIASKSPAAAAEGLDRALEESKHGHEVAATAIAQVRQHEPEEAKTPSVIASQTATAVRSDDNQTMPTGGSGRPSPTAGHDGDESRGTKGGARTRTPAAHTPDPTATATRRSEKEQRTPTVRTATPTPRGREDDDRRQPTPSATLTPSSPSQMASRSGEATPTARPPQPTPTAHEKEGGSDD